jgi:hypothetical protein
MKCSECNRSFKPVRCDARTCGNACRQLRYRRLRRIQRQANRDLLQQEVSPWAKSAPQRWRWAVESAAGDSVALRAFLTREFGDWRRFAPTRTLLTLVDDAAKAWAELAIELRQTRRPR